ncbi:TetR/AcrR family transcriptional regulator [Rubinisphaera margarita]|uniref:TetR/AcrR family transcriptional regulator n=1 Tax=Rubinisphaera margarita TaxID=2909586 RepID=UPI001EE927C3|nr:TetR/AcrR family transcriptional regulator [Rubinisphaera margarita]MCG6156336.1 TetR/AcrR family transcriptional regulator [Rubinisphaera margarita]
MTAQNTSKTATNVEQKREAILRAAFKKFASDGFHETDVQHVADAAGVGKGTVYRHFNTKNELFLETARYCQRLMSQFIREAIGDDETALKFAETQGVGQLLRQIALAFAGFYAQNPDAVEIMLQERAVFRASVFPSHLIHKQQTRAGMDEFLGSVADGRIFRVMDAHALTNTYGDLMFGTVVNGCLEGDTTGLLERMEHAMDIFLKGVEVR